MVLNCLIFVFFCCGEKPIIATTLNRKNLIENIFHPFLFRYSFFCCLKPVVFLNNGDDVVTFDRDICMRLMFNVADAAFGAMVFETCLMRGSLMFDL